MAIDYKTPSEIASDYLLNLAAMKPGLVNTSQTDSDWWVRGQVIGGVMAGIYADQRLIANDAFPLNARHEALDRHLQTYLNRTFNVATYANGFAFVSGATGSVITAGQQFTYLPNNNIYVATSTVNFGTAASASIPVQSSVAGQAQNLFQNSALSVLSPPAGVSSVSYVYGADLSDGNDGESDTEASQAILTYIRSPLAGGKVTDYEQFAMDASPSVTNTNVLRFPFGFGTVGVVITSGTTDIDTALNSGQPIVFVPSAQLISTVQTYVQAQAPITDCVTILGIQTLPVSVTANVTYVTGDNNTIPAGTTLTQGQLVVREIQRAIYKTPPGGRQIGGLGYVVGSEIENVVAIGLSANAYITGTYYQIVMDQQIRDLAATGANLMILANQQPIPGTIIVNSVVPLPP